jgi:hypothetical protein
MEPSLRLRSFEAVGSGSRGALDLSPTGYYSLGMYQGVELIEPLGDCQRRSPFPDYSKAKPDKTTVAYRVDIHVNYGPGDHPVVFVLPVPERSCGPGTLTRAIG